MNVFRLIADGTHLLSFLILLFKVWRYKSSAGVSGKTQVLLAVVFCTRYLDLATTFVSYYNTVIKVIFIFLSYATVISIYLKFSKTYQRDVDTLRFEFLIAAALILALVVNYNLELFEVCWAFSLYLEAVAVWPQFYMISKTRKVLTSVFIYLTALGVYRTSYILNWIYRYNTENHVDLISSVSGSVEVVPFLIFWLYCATKGVVITSEEKWFRKNLYNMNQTQIFTITIDDKSNEKAKDKLPLLEEMAESKPTNPVQNI